MAGLKKKLAQVGQEALERLELPVNIAAGEAKMVAVLRTFGDEVRETAIEEVNRICKGIGIAFACDIRGQDLQLLVMTEQELRITGKISGIDLVE